MATTNPPCFTAAVHARAFYPLLTCLLICAAGAFGAESKEEVEKSFQAFAAEFPKAFWSAGDAYSKSLKLGGQLVTVEEFVASNKAEKISVKESKGRWVGAFDLVDKTVPKEYWGFTFVREKGQWRTETGTKFLGKGTLDLYAQQLGAPSMRKFVDKEIQELQKKK
jgi:hypothetical protein